MGSIIVGKLAPAFELRTIEGEEFTLFKELEKGQTVLLVFLRHLG